MKAAKRRGRGIARCALWFMASVFLSTSAFWLWVSPTGRGCSAGVLPRSPAVAERPTYAKNPPRIAGATRGHTLPPRKQMTPGQAALDLGHQRWLEAGSFHRGPTRAVIGQVDNLPPAGGTHVAYCNRDPKPSVTAAQPIVLKRSARLAGGPNHRDRRDSPPKGADAAPLPGQ
jgi:hypothetical protein